MDRQAAALESARVDALIPHARNARTHTEAQIAQIAASIREFGFTNPVLIDGQNNIIAGHGRVMAARLLGMETVPTLRIDWMTDAQRRAYVIADNKLALNAGWDEELLALELGELRDIGVKLELTGFTDDELAALTLGDDDGPDGTGEVGDLAERFGCPPFSVLNAREGWWQARKAAWHARIGDNGESREGTLYHGGRPGTVSAKLREISDGVSILDPVMSELMVRWFGKPGGLAFDPFAGDSVFGYVSATLGMEFVGIELRTEQTTLNRERTVGLSATYHNDTAANMDAHVPDACADLLFSCPPYADLEVYSNDPRDLSAMSHADFFKAYEAIMANAYRKLKANRFAVIVMGEVRGKGGGYIGTVPKTIQIMERAGFTFYNEIILVTVAATLALRAGGQMKATRKVGKTHQNILVFLKGNAKRAVAELGEIQGVDMTTGDVDG